MKKVFILLSVLFCFQSMAQNVGIGTTAPTGRLQVNHRTTASAVGVKLVDSAAGSSGTVEFRHVDNTKRMVIKGYTESDYDNGQYIDVLSDSSFVATFKGNGMLGVRTGNPLYPLDVNGDINTTGAMRVNGDAGAGGQVLRSNGDGTMGWGSTCQYNNIATFTSTPASPWTVPAGVTKIMVEGWGGGGGGTAYGGGGGGGYLSVLLSVTPGDNYTIQIGSGGPGGTSTATNGGNTFVIGPGGALYSSLGGQSSNFSGGFVSGGAGGLYAVPTGFTSFLGSRGQNGAANQSHFFQAGTSTFYETINSGKGGDAGNTDRTGGDGPVATLNISTSTVARYSTNRGGELPGGGGGPGYIFVTAAGGSLGGGGGASGTVIIHY